MQFKLDDAFSWNFNYIFSPYFSSYNHCSFKILSILSFSYTKIVAEATVAAAEKNGMCKMHVLSQWKKNVSIEMLSFRYFVYSNDAQTKMSVGKSLNYDGLCKLWKYLETYSIRFLPLKPRRKTTVISELVQRAWVFKLGEGGYHTIIVITMCCTESGIGFNFWMNQRLYACDYAVQLN